MMETTLAKATVKMKISKQKMRRALADFRALQCVELGSITGYLWCVPPRISKLQSKGYRQ